MNPSNKFLDVEQTSSNEDLGIYNEQIRKMIEAGNPIKGFVTVVKNKGKPDEQVLCQDKPNLLVDSGRDDFHAGLYTNAGATQTPFNFMALSSNAVAPATSDTTLTGEITTGGLIRVQASTRTHTGGTNQSTVEQLFTATAQHIDVQKSALFDAVTTGTMSHENTFTPVSLEINDTVTVTWTLTLG